MTDDLAERARANKKGISGGDDRAFRGADFDEIAAKTAHVRKFAPDLFEDLLTFSECCGIIIRHGGLSKRS